MRWTRFVCTCLTALLATGLCAQGGSDAAADPRTALAQLPIQPAIERGLKLTVLGADGKPCPSAIVVAIPSSSNALIRIIREVETAYPADPVRQLAALMLGIGKRVALDQEGSVRAPYDTELVYAGIDGDSGGVVYTGARRYEGPRAPATLKLAKVRPIAVEVLQSDGKPADNVQVSLEGATGRTGRITVTTDAGGKATVPFLPIVSSLRPPYAMRALVPTKRGVYEFFEPDTEAPVRLQLPPCASLTVKFQGMPEGTTPKAQLRRAPNQYRSTCRMEPTSFAPQRSDAASATFARVDPDLQWEIAVSLDGMASPFTFAAPKLTAGNAAEYVADLKSSQTWVSVRVLSADGQPLANTDVTVDQRGAGGNSRLPHRTDAAGRLQFVVANSIGKELKVRITQLGEDEMSETLAAGTVKVDELPAGRHELPDVTLTPEPVALQGRVVDTDNKPVAGVRFVMWYMTGQEYTRPTDKDGHFELRLPQPHPAELHLRMAREGDWFFAEAPPDGTVDLPIETGSTTIKVQRAGRVLISFAPTIPPCNGYLEVRLTDDQDPPNTYVALMVPATRSVRLPAGHWNLKLRLYNQELLSVDDVQIDPGVETHDGRLLRIDWRPFLNMPTVRVESPNGKRTEDYALWFYEDRQGARGGQGPGVHDVTLPYILPKKGTIIAIEPADPEFRSVDLGVIEGPNTLKLTPSLEVKLQLTNLPALPEGVELIGRLNLPTFRTIDNPIDAEGHVRFFSSKAGAANLQFAIRKGTTMRYIGNSIPVEIREDPAEQKVEVPKQVLDILTQTIKDLAN